MTSTGTVPQLGGSIFLTDGGCETDLIFNHGVELPEFASFVLHDDPESEQLVRNYFSDYLGIGAEFGLGLVLETLTWRASREWGTMLGYDPVRLADVNRRAADFLFALRDASDCQVVVSGCIGPRGDAYFDLGSMDAEEAERYHHEQIAVLADHGVDLISGFTITNVAEAIGIARASAACNKPSMISFTVETDGLLPDQTTVGDAIRAVDAACDVAPAYYMINCAHPDHMAKTFKVADAALDRIGGLRANASRKSHAELDESTELDDGDPTEFGPSMVVANHYHPNINVLGGCCGTDHRHIRAIAEALPR
jgi:homocysteine S-methyltransferase